MVSLPEPTKEEVFEFLDKLRDSGVTNMFGAASGYIESEFHLEHEKAWEFLSAWMECERCAREIRTVQELRGHQTIESPAFGFTGEDLYRGWTLSSSHSIAIIGAIIGGGIGGYLGIFCVWFLFYFGYLCIPLFGFVGGVLGGVMGYVIHHPSGWDSKSPSRLSGCLGLLGLCFLGLIGSLIFWLVMFAVSA